MLKRILPAVLLVLVALVSCSRDPNVIKQKYVEKGNKYFERGKFKEAALMYRNALQKDAKYGEGYYRLALTELRLAQFTGAVRDLRRAIELLPEGANEVDAKVKLAEVYLAYFLANASGTVSLARERAEVEKTVQEMLKKDPQSYDGNRLMGELHLVTFRGFAVQNDAARARKALQDAIQSFRAAYAAKSDQPALIVALARSLAINGQYDEAEKLYKALIAKDKASAAGYSDLYALYLRQNKLDLAEEILKRCIADNPKLLDFHVLLGAHYFRQGKREEMGRVLAAMKAGNKDLPEVYEKAGDFYFRTGDASEAVRQYQEGMAANADRKSRYRKRTIEVLAAQGRMAEAAKINEEILKDDPEDTDALGLRASLMLEKGDVQQALPELSRVVSEAPDNVLARYNLGRAHMMRQDFELARKQFSECIRIRPNYVPARLGLAQLQMSRGEFEPAIQTAEEALKFDRNNGTAQLILAAASMRMGRFAESQKLLESMLKSNPNSQDATYQLGLLHLTQNKFEPAEEAFRKSFEANPANPRGLLGVAETYAMRKQYDRALQIVQTETARNPSRLDLRLGLANLAVRGVRYDVAVNEYNAILSTVKDPRAQGQIYLRLGETYRRSGDTDAGIAALEKAKALLPGNAAVFLNLAMMLDTAGRRDEARQSYEQALRLDSDNPIALNNLAFLMAESGDDLDRALTMAKRAQQKLPTVNEIADTLGWIYLKKNLSDSALEVFQDLVEKQPDRSTFRYHLGMAHLQKGDKVRAQKELQAALRANPPKEEEGKIKELIAKIG
ncbi:MAG: tetratricopeptide repeat protein [Bryobacteraceae bacterium]